MGGLFCPCCQEKLKGTQNLQQKEVILQPFVSDLVAWPAVGGFWCSSATPWRSIISNDVLAEATSFQSKGFSTVRVESSGVPCLYTATLWQKRFGSCGDRNS